MLKPFGAWLVMIISIKKDICKAPRSKRERDRKRERIFLSSNILPREGENISVSIMIACYTFHNKANNNKLHKMYDHI